MRWPSPTIGFSVTRADGFPVTPVEVDAVVLRTMAPSHVTVTVTFMPAV